MQNKGYSHPYGNTLIPGAPVVTAGPANGHGPPGTPSAIPGTIGVAGPKLTNAEIVPPPAAPSSFGKLFDDFMERVVELVAERAAERIADLVLAKAPTIDIDDGDVREAALRAHFEEPAASGGPTSIGETARWAQAPLGRPGNVIPPDYPLVAGIPIDPEIPAERVEAYSKAHTELQAALEELPDVTMIRRAPSPPAWSTGEGDSYLNWSAYAAEYDNPRFPVPGIAPGHFLLTVAGQQVRLGDGMTIETIVEMVRNRLAYDQDQPKIDE